MSALIEFIAVAVIGKVLVPAGTKLVRDVIGGMSKLPAAGGVQTPPSLVPLKRVEGVKGLHSRVAQAAKTRSDDVDAAKQQMLETLAGTQLYVADPQHFRARVDALRNAATIDDARAAGLALAEAALNGHHRLVTNGVHTAVRNAAVRTGFETIEALNSPLGGNIIRLAATDPLGRTIVTEIDARPERDLKIEAEVVGVTDNTCHQILEDFYAALKDEGIEMSSPPRRKPTGGICELAATKAFLAKKLRPTRSRPAPPAAEEASEDDRRVQMNRKVASQTKVKLIR
jgi:hypothetical protein